MKKRIWCLLLAVCMVCSMLPQMQVKVEAAEHKIVMTAYEFIEYLTVALNRKTKYSNANNLGYYDGDTISWDCWNLGKSIIWSKGKVVYNYTQGTQWGQFDYSWGLDDLDGSRF